MIFPIYWIFEFLAECTGAQLLQLVPGKPLLVEGFAIKKNDYLRVMVANLQHCSQEVHLASLPNGKASLRRLSTTTIGIASSNPEEYLELTDTLHITDHGLFHSLEPYEVAFIEIHSPEID